MFVHFVDDQMVTVLWGEDYQWDSPILGRRYNCVMKCWKKKNTSSIIILVKNSVSWGCIKVGVWGQIFPVSTVNCSTFLHYFLELLNWKIEIVNVVVVMLDFGENFVDHWNDWLRWQLNNDKRIIETKVWILFFRNKT